MAGTIELSEKAFQQMLKKIEEQGGGATHLQERLAELKDAGIANATANSPAVKQSNKMLAQAISESIVSGLSKTLANVIKENNNDEKLERLITQDKEEMDTLNSSVGNLTGEVITTNSLLTDIYRLQQSQLDAMRQLTVGMQKNSSNIGSTILNGIGTALEYIGLKSLINKLLGSGEKDLTKVFVEDVGKTAAKAAKAAEEAAAKAAGKVVEKDGVKFVEDVSKTASAAAKAAKAAEEATAKAAAEKVTVDAAKIEVTKVEEPRYKFNEKTGRFYDTKTGQMISNEKANVLGLKKDVAVDAVKDAGKDAAEAVIEKTNFLKKIGKGAASATGKVAKFVFPPIEVIMEATKTSFLKRGWQAVLKTIPIIGIAAGGIFAYIRWSEGDINGAVQEIASGAIASIPYIGTAASVVIDVNLMVRDIVSAVTATAENPRGLDILELEGLGSNEEVKAFLRNVLECIREYMKKDLNIHVPLWPHVYNKLSIAGKQISKGQKNKLNELRRKAEIFNGIDYSNQKKEDLAAVYAALGMDLPPDLLEDNTSGTYNKYNGTIRNDDFRNRGIGATDASGGTNISGGVGAGTSVRKETPFKTDNGPMVNIGQYKSSVNKVMSKEVYDYLKSKGLDDNHAIGMLANIQAESNFNAGAVGDNGTSGGLFQHHGSRFNNMISAAGPDWQNNWKGQIDYALSEQDSKMFLGMNFKSPEEASAWFTSKWERPRDPSEATKRLGFVEQFKKMFTGNDATNATAPPKSGAAVNQTSSMLEINSGKNNFTNALNNNGGGGSTPPPVVGQVSNPKLSDASKVNGPVGANEHDVNYLLSSLAA